MYTKSRSISSIGKNSSRIQERSEIADVRSTSFVSREIRIRYESSWSASTRENVRFFEDGEARNSVDNVCRKKKKERRKK